LVKALSRHARIFLDLKFLDIPNTVTGALRSVLPLDPYFLTVHATGGMPMMKAVSELLQTHRQQGGQTRSLAVTVLTSFDETEWKNVGQTHDTAASVLNLARLAQQSGMDGGVCSPQEARQLRQHLGTSFHLVCPGIRPIGSDLGDQVRVSDPASALQAGADYLVVGRPITASTHPREAAHALVESIQ
jgi:orotidine-5'-phosphate decarboxylase